MGHPIRYIPGRTLVEVTTRTLEGRLLLSPGTEVNELVRGVVGKGLDDHRAIQLHGYAVLSNHYHLLLTTPDAPTLSSFMRFVNGNIAREINRLRKRSGPFWHRRYRAIPVLDDVSAARRLEYLLGQGVKERLVESPEQWPGASGVTTLLTGEPCSGTWYDRSAELAAARRGREDGRAGAYSTKYEVPLAPLLCWAHDTDEKRHGRVRAMIHRIVRRGRQRTQERGLPPIGAEAICAQSPDAWPRRTERSPAPFVHAATKELAAQFRRAYGDFVRCFREASRRLGEYVAPAGIPPGGAAVVLGLG